MGKRQRVMDALLECVASWEFETHTRLDLATVNRAAFSSAERAATFMRPVKLTEEISNPEAFVLQGSVTGPAPVRKKFIQFKIAAVGAEGENKDLTKVGLAVDPGDIQYDTLAFGMTVEVLGKSTMESFIRDFKRSLNAG